MQRGPIIWSRTNAKLIEEEHDRKENVKSIALEKREDSLDNYDPVKEKGIQIFCLLSIIGSVIYIVFFLFPLQSLSNWLVLFGSIAVIIVLVITMLYVSKEK